MKQFLKIWLRYFWSAFSMSLFINTLQLTFPIYMLVIYDKVLVSRSVPTLITVSVGAVLALMVMACLDFLRSRLLIRAGIAVDRALSQPIVEQMVRDAVRVDSPQYREGIQDLNHLRNFISGNAAFSFFDLPWAPVYLLAVFAMNTWLGLLALGGVLVSLILGFAQEVLTGRRFAEAKVLERHAGQLNTMALRQAEVLTAMNMTPGFMKLAADPQEEVLLQQTQAYRYASLLTAVTRSFRTCMQVLVYGLGAYLVLENKATVGVIIAASIITRQAMNPVDQIMNTWKQTVEARAAYKRLESLLAAMPLEKPMPLPKPQGSLVVQEAGLTLERPLLTGITFTLEPGETLGLIGPSGAGKSTLCRLLLGLWKPSNGTVRLDGADLAAQENMRQHIGYLPQEIELFAGSVSENIARLEEINPEKVLDAATRAGVHELLLRLPQGYDTQVGEMGSQLSGGQRQLVGLARVFYNNPSLVVLDEPNSNLDDRGEQALLTAMHALKKDQVTTIMVTHKPSLLETADKLLVLREGRVVAFGPRETVLKALAGQG